MAALNASEEMTVLTVLLNAAGPVARADLRAKLPEGVTRHIGATQHAKRRARGWGSGLNRTSDSFQRTLYYWSRDGWIERTDTHVEVLDRAALEARQAELQQLHPPRKSIAELEREIAARKANDQ
jgi:hypothetical protein